jgi:mRNA interferase MazF
MDPGESGLPKPSVANVSQLLTLDKSFLKNRVQELAKTSFQRVEAGLRLVLELQ